MVYSRLQRRYDFKIRRQAVWILLGSFVLIIIFFIFGLPLLLNLTGFIGNLRYKSNTPISEDKKITPTTPIFAQNIQATSSAKIILFGYSDPKISVEIFQNSHSLGTTLSDDNGNFTQETYLQKGKNTFTAIAINESGVKSLVSNSYSVDFFFGKPKLEINPTKDGDTIISGQTDPANTITINDRLIIIDSTGKFSYSLNLNSGENKIKVTVTDPAGNSTSKELTIKN